VIGSRESPDGLPFLSYERKGKWAFRLSAWINSPGLIAEIRRDAILRAYSQEQFDAIANNLNTRPRATHNWLTPLHIYAALANAH
jgi:hypothetical protein